jgi:hypothetical protein
MQPASRFSIVTADLIVPTFTRNVKVGQPHGSGKVDVTGDYFEGRNSIATSRLAGLGETRGQTGRFPLAANCASLPQRLTGLAHLYAFCKGGGRRGWGVDNKSYIS